MENKRIKVLVVGDMMIDHYIFGNCTRISPEAPVQVIEIKREECTLGGAGNVLKNLVSFNCEVDVISVVGDDSKGTQVLEELLTLGINGDGVLIDNSRCTTVKSRVIASNHHLIRLDKEDTNPIAETLEQKLISVFKSKIDQFDIVLLSDYNKGLLTSGFLSEIFKIAIEKNITTIVDPKGTDFTKYKGVNIIKPNKKEAAIASGIEIKSASLKEACKVIKQITGCNEVVITLSEEGIALFSANEELTLIPTKALDVIDVTGAGDTVLASLAVSIAAKKSVKEACEFANHAAAIVVSKLGSAVTNFEEIERKFANDK